MKEVEKLVCVVSPNGQDLYRKIRKKNRLELEVLIELESYQRTAFFCRPSRRSSLDLPSLGAGFTTTLETLLTKRDDRGPIDTVLGDNLLKKLKEAKENETSRQCAVTAGDFRIMTQNEPFAFSGNCIIFAFEDDSVYALANIPEQNADPAAKIYKSLREKQCVYAPVLTKEKELPAVA